MEREEIEAKIAEVIAEATAITEQSWSLTGGQGIVGLPPAGSPQHRSVEEVMTAAITHASSAEADTDERLVERIVTELGGVGVDLPVLGGSDDWSWTLFRGTAQLNLSGAAMRVLAQLDAETTAGKSWAAACIAVGPSVQSFATPDA